MNLYQDKKTNLVRVGEELVDLLDYVFAVGIKLRLDIKKEYKAKEKKVNSRTYKRTNQ